MLPSVAIFKTRVYISLSLRLKVGSISEGSRASALVPAATVLLLTLGLVPATTVLLLTLGFGTCRYSAAVDVGLCVSRAGTCGCRFGCALSGSPLATGRSTGPGQAEHVSTACPGSAAVLSPHLPQHR